MTTNAPGTPSWVDLGTPDVAGAGPLQSAEQPTVFSIIALNPEFQV